MIDDRFKVGTFKDKDGNKYDAIYDSAPPSGPPRLEDQDADKPASCAPYGAPPLSLQAVAAKLNRASQGVVIDDAELFMHAQKYSYEVTINGTAGLSNVGCRRYFPVHIMDMEADPLEFMSMELAQYLLEEIRPTVQMRIKQRLAMEFGSFIYAEARCRTPPQK